MMRTWQIRLRDLFFITTFFAVMSWVAGTVGVSHPWFLKACGLAALYSTAFVVLTSRPSTGVKTVVVVSLLIVALFLSVLSESLVLPFLCLAHLVIVYPIVRRAPGFKTAAGATMACTAIVFGLTAFAATGRVRQVRTWRQEYPIEDLKPRLVYESKHEPVKARFDKLATQVQQNITIIESEGDSFRGYNLGHLHWENYESFVAAQGFGMSRMSRVSERALRYATVIDVPFDSNSSISEEDRTWGPRVQIHNDTHRMHWGGLSDFVDPDSLGYAESVQKTAGFVPHSFARSPAGFSRRPLRIRRLELVSLLRHDRPQVYVLDVLPRMDRIANEDVPRRDLNDFESSALVQLQEEEDVVVEEVSSTIHMLGALRAIKQCTNCHNVERGELLGAFTYELEIVTPNSNSATLTSPPNREANF